MRPSPARSRISFDNLLYPKYLRKIINRFLSFARLGHRISRFKFALRVCIQDPTLYPLHEYPIFDSELCAHMFIRNQALLHSFVRSLGAKAITYLHPANGIGTRHMSWNDFASLKHIQRRVTLKGTDELEAMRAFYQHIASQFEESDSDVYKNLSSIFNNEQVKIYIDQVHPSDVGYTLIAARIAQDITRLENKGL